ncbi:MAG: ATP-binding protein, partial [Pseudomonadota bacterium]
RQGLRQVLTNLIGNAVKFTEEGSVTLRITRCTGGAVRFAVIDTGIGIEADALERIFQPFQQADGSMTRRYGGTGLGLTICTEILETWGSRIDVKSIPGSGSVFTFEVSLQAVEAPSDDGASEEILTSAVRPSSF